MCSPCGPGTRPTTRSPSWPSLVGAAGALAIGDRTWARFLVDLQGALPAARFSRASAVLGPLRACKDAAEVGRPAPSRGRRRPGRPRPADGRDRRWSVAPRPRCPPSIGPPAPRRGPPAGELRHRGRGRQRGQPPPRARVPGHRGGRGRAVRLRRHDARRRRRRATAPTSPGASTWASRRPSWPRPTACCSTRSRPPWPPPCSARPARRSTPPPGAPSPRPAGASSSSIAPATASASRSTRTRTSSSGNATPLEAGHAFSIEPGIYVPGRFGFRLEDIVVAATAGPDPLNRADHDLVLL